VSENEGGWKREAGAGQGRTNLCGRNERCAALAREEGMHGRVLRKEGRGGYDSRDFIEGLARLEGWMVRVHLARRKGAR
jgi:hypothetical protein